MHPSTQQLRGWTSCSLNPARGRATIPSHRCRRPTPTTAPKRMVSVAAMAGAFPAGAILVVVAPVAGPTAIAAPAAAARAQLDAVSNSALRHKDAPLCQQTSRRAERLSFLVA